MARTLNTFRLYGRICWTYAVYTLTRKFEFMVYDEDGTNSGIVEHVKLTASWKRDSLTCSTLTVSARRRRKIVVAMR